MMRPFDVLEMRAKWQQPDQLQFRVSRAADNAGSRTFRGLQGSAVPPPSTPAQSDIFRRSVR